MSRWRSSAARNTLRPMRPKPLMPTLTMGPPGSRSITTDLLAVGGWQLAVTALQRPTANCQLPTAMSVQPIRWLDNSLQLLDQRKLPREVVWVTCRDAHEVAAAIRDMVVRGAPADRKSTRLNSSH